MVSFVLSEANLRQALSKYISYYNHWRPQEQLAARIDQIMVTSAELAAAKLAPAPVAEVNLSVAASPADANASEVDHLGRGKVWIDIGRTKDEVRENIE
jgi:hypothetical protein